MGFLNYMARVLSPRSSGSSLFLAPGSSTSLPTSISSGAALRQSTVFACVSVTSQCVASLPIKFYKKDDKGNRELISNETDYLVLTKRPNPFQTAFEFHELMVSSLMLRGVAYARIYRNARGEVVELIPIPADNVKVEVSPDGTDLIYQTLSPKGGWEKTDKTKIMHVKGLHSDLIKPVSPISFAAQYMHLDSNLFQHEAANFGPKAARPGGVIESENKISENAATRLLSLFNKKYAGPGNAGTTMLLDQGMKFKPLNMSNEDSQFLAMRELSIEDLCRIFNVPPSLIHHNKYSTFSNTEQQALSYVKFCLRPLLSRLETAYANALFLDPKLLISQEILFDTAALIRGDMGSYSSSLTRLISGGVITPNEARIMSGFDRMESPGADELYIQQNQISIDKIGAEQTTQTNTKNKNVNQDLNSSDASAYYNEAFNYLLASIVNEEKVT